MWTGAYWSRAFWTRAYWTGTGAGGGPPPTLDAANRGRRSAGADRTVDSLGARAVRSPGAARTGGSA